MCLISLFAWHLCCSALGWEATLKGIIKLKRGRAAAACVWPSTPDPPSNLLFPLSLRHCSYSLQHRSLAVLWACLCSVTRQQLSSNGYQDNAVHVTLWFHEGLIDWDGRRRRRVEEGGEGEMEAAGRGLMRRSRKRRTGSKDGGGDITSVEGSVQCFFTPLGFH